MINILRRTALGLGFASTLVSVASAQKEPTRPTVAPQQEFQFPHVASQTLPNGVHVYVVEDHSAQVIAARVVFGVDSTFDPAGKEGLYQVTFAALREGTTTRTSAQLANTSAQIGTAVAPTAFTTVPTHFDVALGLMGDMLMNPSFDAAAIDRRKAGVAGGFRSYATRPFVPARALMYALLDGRDDAVTRTQYATDAAAMSITREDVKGFYDSHIGPQTMSLVIVGDITPANAVAAATRVFGKWTKTTSATRPLANPPAPKPTTIYLRDIPGVAPYVAVGNFSTRRNAPDASAAEALGSMTNIRFIQALRERRPLIYSGSVTTWWKPAPRAAEFFGLTTVPAVKVDTLLTEWIAMLRSVRAASPSSEDLAEAVNARIGQVWTKTDGADSVASRMSEALRDNLPPDFLGQYAAGLRKVTSADLAAAAAKYIDVDHLVIVVTGDRKTIEPILRAANIAPLVNVDANGKAVSP